MNNIVKAITLTTYIALSLSFAQIDMLGANLSFDAQFDARLGALMSANQQQMLQLFQAVASDPQVQASYQQYVQQTGHQLPYEAFVYYYIMTAGGTNIQGGLQAQQNWFNGVQQAHQTVQQGYDLYNQGWYNNQQILSNTFDNNSLALRGNGYYENPDSGMVYELPYASMLPNSYYEYGGNTFYMDAQGQYYQIFNGYAYPLTARP